MCGDGGIVSTLTLSIKATSTGPRKTVWSCSHIAKLSFQDDYSLCDLQAIQIYIELGLKIRMTRRDTKALHHSSHILALEPAATTYWGLIVFPAAGILGGMPLHYLPRYPGRLRHLILWDLSIIANLRVQTLPTLQSAFPHWEPVIRAQQLSVLRT